MKLETFEKGFFRENPSRRNSCYPIGTIVYYGPDNVTATKVAVGIVDSRYEVIDLKIWHLRSEDIRVDREINDEISEFLKHHNTKRVAASGKVVGCPHEEGKDFPVGSKCPHCIYWSNIDR